jgi:hypothetical protein
MNLLEEIQKYRKITENISLTDIESIKEIWPDADIDLIDSIIYFDYWSGYEDSAALLIFKAIDGSIQQVEAANSASDGTTMSSNPWIIDETNLIDAQYEIDRFKKEIDNN